MHQRVSSDGDVSTSGDKSVEQLSRFEICGQDVVESVDIVLQSGDAWHVRLGADGGTCNNGVFVRASRDAGRHKDTALRVQGSRHKGEGGGGRGSGA